MAGRLSIVNSITIPVFAILLTYLYTFYVHRAILVFGVFRKPEATELAPGDFVVIDGTIHCEDLHYYEPSDLIFTACEDHVGTRRSWFPSIAHFSDPSTTKMNGRLQVIDPKTMKTQNLALEGFGGPFTTHGIEVIPDPSPDGAEAVFVFAVNHKPNPEHFLENGNNNTEVPKAHSVVELFRHVVGSNTAQHVRTIRHSLITTPNDLFAESPSSFFVTNDHYYRDGFLREFEDVFAGARWTNVVHVQLDDLEPVDNDGDGVKASIVLDKGHNLNGMGHGRTAEEVLVTSCASGLLHVGEVRDVEAGKIIHIKEVIEFESTIDNPSYFMDPYANATFNASGIISAGLTRGIEFHSKKGKPDALEPIMVWKASPKQKQETEDGTAWDVKTIFQDDGHRVRGASAAVLVAVDPKEEGGRRRAWLFVTNFHAVNVIAVKIDL